MDILVGPVFLAHPFLYTIIHTQMQYILLINYDPIWVPAQIMCGRALNVATDVDNGMRLH